MNKQTDEIWMTAWRDARMILGAEKARTDPMAWWCLVELLVSYAERKKR